MKLILTNDDGFDAPGLAALRRLCEELGEVVVVAPALPQSGVGHRFTTDAPLGLEEVRPSEFRVEGTPVDCARVALRHIATDADWLLAGINRGGNLGADIYTSGTVAAAREAAILGRPSISISQFVGKLREIDWEASAERARAVLVDLMSHPIESGRYFNVNLPHPEDEHIDCPRIICPPDPSPLDVRYRREGSALHYDGHYHERPRRPGYDIDACFSGMISISRLSLHME